MEVYLRILCWLHMNRKDDVKEVLHNSHLLVHKVDFPLNSLKNKNLLLRRNKSTIRKLKQFQNCLSIQNCKIRPSKMLTIDV